MFGLIKSSLVSYLLYKLSNYQQFAVDTNEPTRTHLHVNPLEQLSKCYCKLVHNTFFLLLSVSQSWTENNFVHVFFFSLRFLMFQDSTSNMTLHPALFWVNRLHNIIILSWEIHKATSRLYFFFQPTKWREANFSFPACLPAKCCNT